MLRWPCLLLMLVLAGVLVAGAPAWLLLPFLAAACGVVRGLAR